MLLIADKTKHRGEWQPPNPIACTSLTPSNTKFIYSSAQKNTDQSDSRHLDMNTLPHEMPKVQNAEGTP
jgi:hypothetical protein